MKLHRRDKLDSRIGGVIKTGLLNQHASSGERFRLLRAAGAGSHTRLPFSAPHGRPDWITPSTARRMRRQQWSMEGRKYAYLVVTASYRLAW